MSQHVEPQPSTKTQLTLAAIRGLAAGTARALVTWILQHHT
jgi:hypothetical protein